MLDAVILLAIIAIVAFVVGYIFGSGHEHRPEYEHDEGDNDYS